MLTRASLTVVREHPELLVFPVLGGLSALAFWVLLIVPLWVSGLIGFSLEYVVLFVLYFATTFVASLFSAALIHAVNDAFHGRDPDLRRSVAAAWEMKGPLFVWSLIAATVSVVLRMLEDRDTPIANLLKSLFVLDWTVTTFFVVPVIVFEDVTARTMFTRSAETFRETWGSPSAPGSASH